METEWSVKANNKLENECYINRINIESNKTKGLYRMPNEVNVFGSANLDHLKVSAKFCNPSIDEKSIQGRGIDADTIDYPVIVHNFINNAKSSENLLYDYNLANKFYLKNFENDNSKVYDKFVLNARKSNLKQDSDNFFSKRFDKITNPCGLYFARCFGSINADEHTSANQLSEHFNLCDEYTFKACDKFMIFDREFKIREKQ